MSVIIKPSQFSSQGEYEAALVSAASEQARKAAAAEWKASEQTRKLAHLHKDLGFDSVKELIDALREFLPGAGKKTKATGSAKTEGKRTRTTITPEIRASVKQLAATGAKAPSIAKSLGLSAPTVYNILKA
jgi:hypothetical protein